MPKVQVLKCWPEYYDAIKAGRKRFEVRREDDRTFEVGDALVLCKYDPATATFDRDEKVTMEVTYLMRGPDWDIPEGVVVLSIAPWDLRERSVDDTSRAEGGGR